MFDPEEEQLKWWHIVLFTLFTALLLLGAWMAYQIGWGSLSGADSLW
jgi:hypothetical protein